MQERYLVHNFTEISAQMPCQHVFLMFEICVGLALSSFFCS